MADILIVEDDKDLNTAYNIILKNEGYSVKSAYNGKEALRILASYTPDLILLDLLMPIMGGLELLQHYNLKNKTKVRVLIFTNMENSPEVTKAYDLGASRCIIKSWTAPQNLSKVVQETLNQPPKRTSKKVKAKSQSS